MTIAEMEERLARVNYKNVRFTVDEIGSGALVQAHFGDVSGEKRYVTVWASEERLLQCALQSTIEAEAVLIRRAFREALAGGPDYSQIGERTGSFIVTVSA